MIFPGGQIRQLDQPVKAAELMLESPNYFLVNSQSLQIGRRFSALNADEDLEVNNVYIMFPMKRVNSVVTVADVGVFFLAARRGFTGNGKIMLESDSVPMILPETEVAAPRLNLEDSDEFTSIEFRHRMSISRSKKPVLETIDEEL